MTVYEYFTWKFGCEPEDETLKDLDVRSPCGGACVKAIDAGAALIEQVESAFGKDRLPYEQSIREISAEVVSCLWRG